MDPVSESQLGSVAHFHLFHGHVFGLHPASGELLRTATGQKLVGSWLSEHGDVASRPGNEESLARRQAEPAFGRLLYAIYVAILHYAGRRDHAAFTRRQQPISVGGPELVGVQQQVVERRTGRKPRHRSLYSSDS